MSLLKYIKPSGAEVEINEAMVDYAKSQGWKPAGEKPIKKKAKK